MTDPRVVITHDFMEVYGGAERVTQEIAREFPSAQVFALIGRTDVAERMDIGDRFTSLLEPRDALLRHYRLLAPFYGPWVDRQRLPHADVVIASSYAYAHRLRSVNDAPVLCYCHSPLRFAWSMTEEYRQEWARSRLAGLVFHSFAASVRRGDRRAAHHVARYMTQSRFTAEQIARFYGREAEVIGAPIDCEKFRPDGEPGDHFLMAGRIIEPYKRVGLAVEAFRRLGARLIVAGDGPALAQLRSIAPPNVEFTGQLRDDDLIPLMQTARAVVFPSRDDFGLVPVEAMACGRPVVAYGDGGARYTVRDGETGVLFAEQTEESLIAAIERLETLELSPERIREHALAWDRTVFRKRVREAVTSVVH